MKLFKLVKSNVDSILLDILFIVSILCIFGGVFIMSLTITNVELASYLTIGVVILIAIGISYMRIVLTED